jgi:hypothetical protein
LLRFRKSARPLTVSRDFVVAGEKTVRLFRRRLVALLLVGFATAFCKEKPPPEVLTGDGVAAKDSREVAPFSRISVGSKFYVEISVGKPSRLELEGDKNLLSHVTSRSVNGTLTLDTDVKVKPAMKLRARVGASNLDSAHATGAAVVDIQGLTADKFEARTDRAGKVIARGSAKTFVLEGKDAGSFDFTNVPASSATVRLERGSRAELGYLEVLDVTLSGAALATYVGTPEIKKAIHRPARLIRRDE